ncbi:membrane metallo-endopeptidase-like 1 isoform X2 [Dermacentor silvarum]|uniref:membrane metallo-endopeptidase-like 1 isoform X2 n=1 Tax=Dermacentor silvarum TaxID=543639 RepID=UPI002101C05E|nr:membrane metallo-endopeptidase-like 1 isoform X2 [Dermacentor silvarum]
MDISDILYVEIGKKKAYARKPVSDYAVYIKPMLIHKEIKKVTNLTAIISNTIKFLKPGIENAMLENLTNQLVEFSLKIPLSALLKKEFEKVNITLYDTETVNVYDTYCWELSKFLDTANPNTLYNYGGFLTLFPYLGYVNISNVSERKSRNWSECITLLDESARDVLDNLYITNEPNHTAIKTEVEDIARKVIEAFNETLQKNSWIDSKTRQAFEKQLKEAPMGIGYPEALLDMSALEALYKYVPYFPSNTSFTEALYYFRENLYKMNLRKFRHPEESNWR